MPVDPTSVKIKGLALLSDQIVQTFGFKRNARGSDALPLRQARAHTPNTTVKPSFEELELVLARSESFRRLANQLAHIGHWWWQPVRTTGRQEDGKFFYSEECAELLGYPIERLCSELNIFSETIVHHGDRGRFIASFDDFWHGHCATYQQDYRFIHPNLGTRYMRSTAEKKLDTDGNIIGAAGTIQDVTDLRQAQVAKQSSDAMIRRTHRMMRLGHWSWEAPADGRLDQSGDFTYSSEAEDIMGRQAYELNLSAREFAQKFVHPEDRSTYIAAFNDLWHRSGGSSIRVEYRYLHPTQGHLYINEIVEKMWDLDGNLIQVAGTFQDVTEARERERQLTEARNDAEIANRSKSEFLANMSHELRTPLNAIIGFSQIISGQLFGPANDRYMAYAKDIADSGAHLLNLISDILDISKLEAGKHQLADVAIDVQAEIQQCLKMVSTRATEKRIRIFIDRPLDVPDLIADSRALKQVLINILSNAVKFTKKDGEIRIRHAITARGFEIAVSDTGIGISSAKLETLFHPFQQADSQVSRQFGGTGLGLYISKLLMTLHGGTIVADSTEGIGTTMTLVFPPARIAAAK